MRIVMLTDDRKIDRRIMLEAETLCAQNYEVIVLALWEHGLAYHEVYGNVKIERIQPVKKFSFESVLTLFFSLLIRTMTGLSRKIQSKFSYREGKQGFSQKLFRVALTSVVFVFHKIVEALTFVLKANLYVLRTFKKRTAHDEMFYQRACYYAPDIIHVHDLPQLRAGTLVKKQLNIPLIYDAHELYPEISTLNPSQKKRLSKLEHQLLPLCDGVITVNAFIAKEMSYRYHIKPPQVILNATQTPAQFSLDKKYNLFREYFCIAQNEKILLFQGWMSKDRGLQTLVQAMKEVPSHIHLVLMGYGEALPELETLVSSLCLENRVHFRTVVAQDELLYWTASADVGIIPYQAIDLNNYYCSPNKLFEFIQARIPIIANDLPFLRKIVHDEAIGIVAPLTGCSSYANAIQKVFELEASVPGFKHRLNAAAKKYHWRVEGEKLYSIYQQVTVCKKQSYSNRGRHD